VHTAQNRPLHRKKKVREFPVPSRDDTTKLSLGGNNDVITELFLPRESLVSDIPAGDGKLVNLFLRCRGPGVCNLYLLNLAPVRRLRPLGALASSIYVYRPFFAPVRRLRRKRDQYMGYVSAIPRTSGQTPAAIGAGESNM
jgi:hypothetical protein